MCQNYKRSTLQEPQREKKFRLSDFFNDYWDIYARTPKEYIRSEVYTAVRAIRACRTEILGIEQYVCEECGEISDIYHSCKNRFCPTCSWTDTMKWAEKLQYKMFNLKHRHVVFTLPHKLIGLIKRNDAKLLSILLKTTADVFKDWMSAKYNVKPGIISVLHTFGEQKNYHAHVHMIVSWGGLDADTKLLKEIKGEYVKYKFLQQKFRAKFEDELVRMFKNKTLKHKFKNRFAFMRFLKDINGKNWHFHIEPPIDNPVGVIRYIGRYSKRACLSEYKITKMGNERISFEYKDYKNLDINGKPIIKEKDLHYTDFFPLLLQHVPFWRFRLVRYYGCYASASKIPDEFLFKPSEDDNAYSVNDKIEKAEDLKTCSYCNIKKTYLFTIFKDNRIVYDVEYENICSEIEAFWEKSVA